MEHRSHIAMISALLLALFPVVKCDILPVGGSKFIPYEVEIASMPDNKDMKIAIFPWSMSNGAPTAEIIVVSPQKPVPFGRRVSGQSKFWAIPTDKIGSLPTRGPHPGAALAEWLKTPGNAVACTGAEIDRRFTSPHAHDSKIIDRFIVRSMDAKSCDMEGPLGFQNKADLESLTNADIDPTHPGSRWGSWAISIVAMGAVCALTWRLSCGLPKSGQAPVSDKATAFE